MKVDRLTALVRTSPVAPRAGQSRELAVLPGETVLLFCEEVAGDDLVATVNGISLRLAGLRRLRDDLQRGDSLLMRVLSIEPELELELYGGPTRPLPVEVDSITSYMARQHAMQLDQAALSQIAWRLSSAAELARSWQSLAQSRWSALAAHDETGDAPTRAPPSAAYSQADGAMPSPTSAQRLSYMDRWLFPVHARNGVQMLLGLAQSEDEPEHDARRRRRLALVLVLEPVGLGRIVLHVQWMSDGIQLLIAIEQPNSAQVIREATRTIASALSRADLRLVRCLLVQGSAAPSRVRAAPPRLSRAQLQRDGYSSGLYRALAEVALVLMDLAPGPAAVIPASR